jgi:hypothetical protein
MNRGPLVIASRTMLLMMLIAAIALTWSRRLPRPDRHPRSTAGFRSIFGQVFGVIAIGLAGPVPRAPVGLWAMTGAT